MAGEETGSSETNNEAPADNQPDNAAGLEDTLYKTMDGGEEKPASEDGGDAIGDNGEKNDKTGDAEDKGETSEGEDKDGSVEDDNLIGAEESEDDKAKDDDEGEKKPEDDDKGDDKEDKDSESKAPKDYKLQLEETSLLSNDAIKQVEEIAKKHNLSQEAAEAVLTAKEEAVEEHQKFLDDTVEERAQETVDGQRKIWLADSKADPDIGGDKYAETVAKGNRFINAAASPGMKAILKKSGLGNHKDFMSLCAKGADLAGLMDDNVDLGGDNLEGEKELQDNLYTTM